MSKDTAREALYKALIFYISAYTEIPVKSIVIIIGLDPELTIILIV